MNNFFKGCLIFFLGGLFTFFAIIALIIVITVNFSKHSSPKISKNTILELNFDGNLIEYETTNELSHILSKKNEMQLYKYLKSIEKATKDPNIDGILINGDFSNYARVHVEEIRQVLENFANANKPIYAYMSNGTNTNYSLCIVADKIFMPNTDGASLSLFGYNTTMSYYKDTFDKIGITADVIHIGDYKGSYENLSRNKMSDELRSSYSSVFDDIHNQLLNDIAASRHFDKNKLISYFANGQTTMMNPSTAKSLGFIDDCLSYQEIKSQLFNNKETISIKEYSETVSEKILGPKIAVIYAEGSIIKGLSNTSSSYETTIGDESFIEDLHEINKDNTIKAVVLRINSPGGSALASELMLQELMKTHITKPIYVSFGPMAASGGYYISSIPNVTVFTSPSTITGSIGVLSVLLNVKGLTDKIGINNEVIKKYKFDDIYSPMRPMTDEEREIMVKSMLGIYKEFTNHVCIARNIKSSAIESIAQGRIWTGNQAINNGLANKIGGLLDTINFAATENNIKNYAVVSYPKPQTIIEKLLSETSVKMQPLNVSTGFKDIDKMNKIYNYYKNNGTNPGFFELYVDEIK